MNKRIKMLRKHFDLTQQKFADKIGSKRNTVAKYETGDTTPSTAVISLICKTFSVNEEWLRTGHGDMFVDTPDNILDKLKQEYRLDNFSYGLICEYLKLDDKKRDIVRNYIHNVISYEDSSEATATLQDTHTLTRKELHAELDRQLDLEKEAAEKSGVLPKSS